MSTGAIRDRTPYEQGDRLRTPRHLLVGAESNPRIALITQACNGVGFLIARELCKQGFHVLITDDRHLEMKRMAEELQREGLRVHIIPFRSKFPFFAQLVSQYIYSNFGRLNVLVNHSNFVETADFSTTVDDLTQVLNRQNEMILELTRLLVPSLCRGSSPRIVNSCILANYLTTLMVSEHAKHSILINAVYKQQIETFPGSNEYLPCSNEDLAESVVSAALLPDNGPHGQVLGNSYFW